MPPSPIPRNRPRRTLTRGQRVLFRLLLLVGVWGVMELLSLGGLWLWHSGWSQASADMLRESHLEQVEKRIGESDEVLHPFVGFVRRPTEQTRPHQGKLGISDFGYLDDSPPLRKRGDDRVLIGIVGGSVAEEFATAARGEFERQLRMSPEFQDKKLEFVRLAMGGYKQPQQLLTVTYLLALGAEFDILINVDGYNEIVLPAVENRPAQTFPGFPRVWQARIIETSEMAVLRKIGRVSYLRERTRQRAGWFCRPPWRYSPTMTLLWASLNNLLQAQLNREVGEINALKQQDHDYAVTGPPLLLADDAAYHEYCAELWKDSSWQLHQLATANGIRYFHFLQPNQYDIGSKPQMGAEERIAVFKDGHPGKLHVEQGYPILRRKGEELSAAGVRFIDLTGMFVDHPERVYSDYCCHLTDHGNNLLAERIAQAIR
ncbi:MAG: hypothetical protein ACKV0T_31715 [Planctomycetales bacterium]